ANAGGNRPPAQNPNANRPPRQNPPPNQNRGAERAEPRPRSVDRPSTRPNQPQLDRNPQGSANRPPAATGNRQNGFAPGGPGGRPGNAYDRPNGAYSDRPSYDPNRGARPVPRQQSGVGSDKKPFVEQMRDLSPRDREHVLQNSRTFQNLAP